MSCTSRLNAGPTVTLVRNTISSQRFRAFKLPNSQPFHFITENIPVRFVVSTRTGVTAPFTLDLSSAVPGEIDIDPADDGSFVVNFPPAIFNSLPNDSYYYAIYGHINGEPFSISMPAKLAIVVSIGP